MRSTALANLEQPERFNKAILRFLDQIGSDI
jgi:hypothetical protein